MNRIAPLASTDALGSPPRKRGKLREVWSRIRRDKAAIGGLVTLVLLGLVGLLADQIAPYGYDDQNIPVALKAPGELRQHPLGTDSLGRDMLSRLIYGARVSLIAGLSATAMATLFGMLLGGLAGFYGGRLDNVIMRVMDILLSVPGILLAIAVAATLGPGLRNAVIAVGTAGVPIFARVVRGSILSVREMEYIEAARAINASDPRLMLKHVFPNVLAPVIVQFTLEVGHAIMEIAALSFLGLGAQPPIPEWGSMISSGRGYLRDHSYMMTMPGLGIMLTVFSINLLGDGLRDALDPRLKH
jgi:peptide/nickel transport system permease protein